jgi:molybdenum cofactor biosynthesis enzyme MoaA
MEQPAKNRQREAPFFANINLLGKCNFNCFFCLGKDLSAHIDKHNQLAVHYNDWANFRTFLAKCAGAGIRKIYVTGQNTDALLYKHLDELVDYLQNAGFDVGIRTNGVLAPQKMETINKCRASVGYTIHSLDPDVHANITGRVTIPDWNTIIPATKNVRVSIVLNWFNVYEFWKLLGLAASFPNVKYIQVRRISTDNRFGLLQPDMEIYEAMFHEVQRRLPQTGTFYGAEVFNFRGKDVLFWRTTATSANSFNYFTDGTISEEYFIVEGYLKNYEFWEDVKAVARP